MSITFIQDQHYQWKKLECLDDDKFHFTQHIGLTINLVYL